jgi:hypothetical protein
MELYHGTMKQKPKKDEIGNSLADGVGIHCVESKERASRFGNNIYIIEIKNDEITNSESKLKEIINEKTTELFLKELYKKNKNLFCINELGENIIIEEDKINFKEIIKFHQLKKIKDFYMYLLKYYGVDTLLDTIKKYVRQEIIYNEKGDYYSIIKQSTDKFKKIKNKEKNNLIYLESKTILESDKHYIDHISLSRKKIEEIIEISKKNNYDLIIINKTIEINGEEQSFLVKLKIEDMLNQIKEPKAGKNGLDKSYKIKLTDNENLKEIKKINKFLKNDIDGAHDYEKRQKEIIKNNTNYNIDSNISPSDNKGTDRRDLLIMKDGKIYSVSLKKSKLNRIANMGVDIFSNITEYISNMNVEYYKCISDEDKREYIKNNISFDENIRTEDTSLNQVIDNTISELNRDKEKCEELLLKALNLNKKKGTIEIIGDGKKKHINKILTLNSEDNFKKNNPIENIKYSVVGKSKKSITLKVMIDFKRIESNKENEEGYNEDLRREVILTLRHSSGSKLKSFKLESTSLGLENIKDLIIADTKDVDENTLQEKIQDSMNIIDGMDGRGDPDGKGIEIK